MDLNLLEILSGFTSRPIGSVSQSSDYSQNSVSSSKSVPAGPTTSDFVAQYKARPIKFTHPTYSRVIAEAKRRKSARLAVVMEKRNISNSSGNISCASSSNQSQAYNDRKQQLEKWKKEKKLREAAANSKNAPAFKVGLAPPAPVVPVPLCPITAPVAGFDFRKPKPLAPVTTRPASAAAAISQPTERRVTRNMAKLCVASSVPVIGPPAPGSKKPATARATAKKPVGPSSPKKIDTKNVRMTFSCDTGIQTDTKETTCSSIQTEAEATTIAPSPPPAAPKKKPKGMNFDETFMKYNQSFVTTCAKLSQLSKKWTQLIKSEEMNGNEIPEEYHGEVHAILGSTFQLIQSKMPQFAELLGFYLLKNQDPVPTLPHDLEGWWAVGMIQVEKVLSQYEKLDALEANGWKALDPKTPKKKAPTALKLNENAENIPPKPKGIKATATSGLKAFLAAKRGNAESQAQPMK